MFKVSQLAGFGAGVVGTPALDKLLLESGDFLLLEDGTSRLNLDTGSVDPYFSNVVLLLSFDGTDGDTTTPDSSNSNHTVTFANGANLDDIQEKFGTTSLLTDGIDDRVSVADSEDWNFGTGQFTVECFARHVDFPGQQALLVGRFGWVTGEQAWGLLAGAGSPGIRFYYRDSGGLGSIDATFNGLNDRWYHYAVDRDASNVIRVYVDGTVMDSVTDAANILNPSQELSIGRRGPATPTSINAHNGWIDSARVTKGVARYAGAFTPPDNPFPLA